MTTRSTRLLKARIHDALIFWVWVPAGIIVTGKIFDRVLSVPSLLGNRAVTALGILLILGGTWLIQRAIRDLARYGHGTPNPMAAPKYLVQEGTYRICRHPMYLGYDLAALGVVILFRSTGMLLLSYPAFMALEIRSLRLEEGKLERRFREAYSEYKRRTPMLVPWISPRRSRP